MDDNNLIIEILVRHSLRQKLNEEETARLEQWCAHSKDRRLLVDKFRNPQWVADQRKRLHSAPTAEMWTEIRGYIEKNGALRVEPVRIPIWQRIGWRRVGWIAAGISMVSIATWRLRPAEKHVKEAAIVRTAAPGKREYGSGVIAGAVYHLPDESVVTLDKNSRLRYYEDASNSRRVGELEGEASFEVATLPSRPFVLRLANDVYIQVLGTSFNARAYAGETDNWVTVLSGQVRVGNGRRSVVLNGGQEARIDARGEVTVSNLPDPSTATAWMKRDRGERVVIDIDSGDLKTVLRAVATLYGVQISNPNNVPGCAIRATLSRNETLKSTLNSIEGLQRGKVRLELSGDTVRVVPLEPVFEKIE